MSIDARIRPKARDVECAEIYHAAVRPGFACWVSLWRDPSGDLMLAFEEKLRRKNPHYRPCPLEFYEAMTLPIKYQVTICGGGPDICTEHVVMRSKDEGATWSEIGRSESGIMNLFAYTSLPNGDILRCADTSYLSFYPEEVPHTVIQKSSDGGNTWTDQAVILERFFAYGYRLKRLSDGTLVLLCPYMSSFGPGRTLHQRGEERPRVMQELIPAMFYSQDHGKTWTNPQTVLPGILAWEPDFVELPSGDLLVINSRVQHGAAVRQYIHKTPQGWIPGPVFKIESDGVPESVCCTSDGLLVGSTRHGPYTCSNDEGDTWYEIEEAPNCEYQPMTIPLKDGRFLTAWHKHGDCFFGEHDQFVGQHVFSLERTMPARTMLQLRRDRNEEGTKYLNAFTATLAADGKPLPGYKVVFTVQDRYRDTYDLEPPAPTPYTLEAIADSQGQAHVHLEAFDRERNIHHSYTIDARFVPEGDDLGMAPCESGRTQHYGLTPERGVGNPYPLYVAGGCLFLRRDVVVRYPEIEGIVQAIWDPREFTLGEVTSKTGLDPAREREVLRFLMDELVLDETETGYRWRYRLDRGTSVIEIEDDMV